MLEGGAQIASLSEGSCHNMEQTLGFKYHAEKTILVVDDDPATLSFVSGFLDGRYNVDRQKRQRGYSAIREIQRRDPSFVV